MVLQGDAAHLPLPDESVDLLITSPPYWALRSYADGGEHYQGQLGSEATPREYLDALLACTKEWIRVLKPSGSLFVNLGDKYAQNEERSRNGNGNRRAIDNFKSGPVLRGPTVSLGRKDNQGTRTKSLLGLPWRYALGCMDDLGLILRRDIIWSKPNGLPESVTDRCRSSHEYLFHLVRQPRYYAAVDEIREAHTSIGDPRWRRATTSVNPDRGDGGMAAWRDGKEPNHLGKLPGSVWEIPSQPLTVPASLGIDHFAAFPMELPRRVILGWSPPGICTACGEGRRPVVDKQMTSAQRATQPRSSLTRYTAASRGVPRRDEMDVIPRSFEATITGYACACTTAYGSDVEMAPPTRPAVVLDPFGGTGTTALVAAMHGRTGISVDRSADYCRLARWRVTDPAERAKAMCVPKPPPVPDGIEPLFGLNW